MNIAIQSPPDAIAIELLRYRLEALCDEGGRTIERTAISPVVTEAKDYSCTLLSDTGEFVIGGGKIRHHFFVATNAVKATLALHGATIALGDIFLVNDPHNGGGLHAQDVFILVPVFIDQQLTAWLASSAHMMDMGGMVPGSWCPDATECFQEALRLPPVRISRQGEEQSDIWAIIRNNIRMPDAIEMDIRGLISGCNVAATELIKVIQEMGAEAYKIATADLNDRVELEVKRRISELEEGVYRAESWCEWGDELFHIPCKLTVANNTLNFDFEGASPQTTHFFNSKEYIVTSEIGTDLAPYIAHDLPYNAGLFRAMNVSCPEGSILNSLPPAPVGAAHMEVCVTAVECAIRAVLLAVAASPKSSMQRFQTGPTVGSGYTMQIWSGQGHSGGFESWLMIESMAGGGAGSPTRDGQDLGVFQVAHAPLTEYPDVEVMEAWYPWKIISKRTVYGSSGYGAHSAGGRLELIYEVYGTEQIVGASIGNRQRVPVVGSAGGYPGGVTETNILRVDGTLEVVDAHTQGVVLNQGDRFICLMGASGGWGDPLDRDPQRVKEDVASGKITAEIAHEIYGVVGGKTATEQQRQRILADRLARATPAEKPITRADIAPNTPHETMPLYIGVEQKGATAFSARTGAPLAIAPDHWTEGCPTIERFAPSADDVNIVAYLDPESGHLLCVDVVAKGHERSFASSPNRWLNSPPQ